MPFTYPYKSWLKAKLKKLRQGRDYFIWQDSSMPKDLQGPIIEIGGPTELGYYFLDGLPLQTKPIITNISAKPLQHSPRAAQFAKQVDEVMDATNMKYADDSVGVFFMAAMSISSDWWVDLDDTSKENAAASFEEVFDNAKLEMGQIATGILSPDKAKHAQRVRIYREVYRTLRKGGLFFTDGGIEEITILKLLGFNVCILTISGPRCPGMAEPRL
ncbi:MAG TPA: hypothetical protein VK694_00990 [Verrucomicrobiae bacterium]|nr:hypothetical protein [Verrucomicrobiae bacterium]